MKYKLPKKTLEKIQKFQAPIVAIIVLLILIITVYLDFANKPKIIEKPLATPDNAPGITFARFWREIKNNSEEFLQGKDLYIISLESVNVSQFSKQKGRAGMWVGKIARCEQFYSKGSETGVGKIECLGQSATVKLADPKLTGLPAELVFIPDEITYAGPAVKASSINHGAGQVEEIVIADKNIKYSQNDDFGYKLTVDPLTNTAKWQVSHSCSITAKRDGSCDTSQDWWLFVDANSGKIL